jgi:hypothetical protein
MEDHGMEHTNTFETTLQNVLAAESEMGQRFQSALHAVDRAQDTFEEEFRRLKSADHHEEVANALVEALAQRWRLQTFTQFDEHNAELAFIGDQMLEAEGALEADDFVPQAILGRKRHHDKLYYKVAWRGRNLVTWELEDAIDNKKLIAEFERWFLSRAMMPRTGRLRPAVYISRRLVAASRQMQQRLEVIRASNGGQVTWSCEVEPFIWIPYDEEEQASIERSFASGREHHSIHINNARYIMHFDLSVQERYVPPVPGDHPQAAVGTRRNIRRFVQLDPEVEARMMADMSDEDLRQYVASIPEILPVHYEALMRLHDADKVPQTASVAELNASLFVDTFEEIMNHVLDGKTYPCFSSECFVCLEDYNGPDAIAHLICGHFFHKSCAFQYFERYSRLCPICKEDVL